MKKILLFSALALLAWNLEAVNLAPVNGRIISYETSHLPGKIKVDAQVYVHDSVYLKTVRFFPGKKKKHTAFSRPRHPHKGSYKLYAPGDSVKTTFYLDYNRRDLPYYPQEAVFEAEYYLAGAQNGECCAGEPQRIEMKAMIYFTPYYSVEVWDIADFHNLKRVWLAPDETAPKRKYISKYWIPESDINGKIDLKNQPWRDDWNMIFIDGLAYAIPMQRKAAPEIAASAHSESQSQWWWKKKWNGYECNYKYTISGNVYARFTDDLGDAETLNPEGLEVEFYKNEKYSFWGKTDDEFLGKTAVSSGGNFAFDVDISQSWMEGDAEIYLVIKAADPENAIAAKTSFGKISNQHAFFTRRTAAGPFRLSKTYGKRRHIDLDIELRDDSFLAVEYTRRALDFCRDNQIDIPGQITLWPYFPMKAASFYMTPGLYERLENPPTLTMDGNAAIYLDRNFSGDENIIYHETGSHVMWSLQDESWIEPVAASFAAHHGSAATNAHTAWIEGWANGFMAMCDLANFETDKEFQFGSRQSNWENGAALPGATRGYEQIQYIGRAIFDLFDGADKFSRYNVNGTPWEHRDEWPGGRDEMSLTLEEICRPLLTSNPPLKDVDDYFRQLIDQFDCSDRTEIKRIFDNNFITDGAGNGFSTDIIGYADTRNYKVERDIFGASLNTAFSETFLIDAAHLPREGQSFNLAPETTPTLSDNLTISGDGSLYVNGGMPHGFFDSPGGSAQRAPLDVNTCDGTRVSTAQTGTIFLGDGSAGNEAHWRISNESLLEVEGSLEISDGSILTIEAGGTLHIKDGANVIVSGSGRIAIEPGGYLCVEPSANIVLEEASSFIVTTPGSISGINPALDIEGSCLPFSEIPYSGAGKIVEDPDQPAPPDFNALQFDGIDDKAIVHDAPEINFGTENFTIEVKFQSAAQHATNKHQALLSKRSYVRGPFSDGFLLGLWPSGADAGRAFIQMAGSPNVISGSPNLFDGRCHQLSVVKENDSIYFYADGQLASVHPASRNISSPGSLFIGYDGPEALSFNGIIGEVRLWRRALPADEILALQETTLSGSETDLTALWDMNDRSGQVVPSNAPLDLPAILGDDDSEEDYDPVWVFNDCDKDAFRLASVQEKITVNPYDSALRHEHASYHIKSYPNPFQREVRIKVEGAERLPMTLIVTDLYGREIYRSGSWFTNEFAIIDEDWQEGIYVVKAKFGASVREMKILKLGD